MLRNDSLSKLIAEFEQFVRSRAHAPETHEELADCARAYFGSGRGPVGRDEPPAGLGFDLPKDLKMRGQAWTAAALEREELSRDGALWRFGFDDVPFPGNAALADEFVEWWRKKQVPLTQLIVRSAPVPSAELANVLEGLRLRCGFSNVRWTEEEYEEIVRKSAVEQLESAVKSLSGNSGCSPEDAARWILAGVAPTRTAVTISITKHYGGPDEVEMHINPVVATPEDVRLAYRRAIRALGFPRRGERLAHFDSSSWTWGGADEITLDYLYELWNDVHPLWRFKSLESFRVSRLNAIKRYRPTEEVRKLKRRRPAPPVTG